MNLTPGEVVERLRSDPEYREAFRRVFGENNITFGNIRQANGSYFFRVPVLRNVVRTAPYFHNGAVKDLHEAVRIMSKYQLGREFTPAEINDTVAFLKSLNGEIVDYGY